MLRAGSVPLATSAEAKLGEAVYFRLRMTDTQTNVREFPYNLSAFLSALRSVTFHLQAQCGRASHFQEWYDKKQAEMRNDVLLRMLKEVRDEALHVRPVPLFYWVGTQLPRSGVTTARLEITATVSEAGELVTTMKLEDDAPPVVVPTEVKWLIDLPEAVDVLAACDSGLARMTALLDEWAQLCGSAA